MPHHYRTRSTTGTGTSSAKMEAKRIADDDLDPFNNIPSSIIEHILCLLPIKDAVRTSILSKNWRYYWAKIPKLEFILEDMINENQQEELLFADSTSGWKKVMRRCKLFSSIHQVLFMHQAPILDFTFSAMEPDYDTFVEIEQLIIQLARRTNNTVKKFTFEIRNKALGIYSFYEFPRSIFLLRHLTDLHIKNCTLDIIVPTLDGFGSLKSLFLRSGRFLEKPLLHLLANCPLLKKLKLLLALKGMSHCINIIELFKCLPVIEDLTISQWIFEKSHVTPELPMALIHLKCLCLTSMMLLDTYGLQFLFLVIRRSPNLEKIELHINNNDYFHFKTDKDFKIQSDALKDCSDIWLEHLKEMEIIDFANLKHEMKFVKLILKRAPMLKKVRIVLGNSIKRGEELKIARHVSRSRRVSPFAEIIVQS